MTLAQFLLSAEIATVICDKPEKALILIKDMEKGLIPSLKMIIIMDPFEDDLKERGEKSGIEILSLLDAEVMGLKLSPQLEGRSDTVGSLQAFYTGCCCPGRGGRRGVNLTHAVKL